MTSFWRRTTYLILFALLAFPYSQDANAQAGVTLTVRAGFDRMCKEGQWIPLRVTLENNGSDLEGQVEARLRSSTGIEIVYAAPVTLPNVSRKELRLYIFPQGYLSEIPVRLVAGGKILVEEKARVNCVSAADSLFGVLAGSGLAGYSVLANLDPANGTATVAELEAGDLPDNSLALEALDVLVLADIDTGDLTTRQQAALTGWVAQGGRLWIAGGPGWQKTAAGLGALLPLVPDGVQTIDDISALQALSTSQEPLEGSLVAATGRPDPDAEVLVRSAAGVEGVPLIVRKRIGAGEAVFLAADPGLAPLKGWDGSIEIYRSLLSSERKLPVWAYGFQDWYLASQAAATLPSVNLPSGFLICGLLGLYILAIGPLNYLILRKLKRRELAWVSIPILVIVFSGMSFLFGSQLRGNRPILNRLAIVHLEAGSPQATVDGLIGVYSPDRKSYQVEAGRDLLMHPLPNNEGIHEWFYRIVDGDMTIPDLRVDIGGIMPLALEGRFPAPAIIHDLSLSVQESPAQGVRLVGNVTNNSDITLYGAVLLAPGIAQPLGELQPGEIVPVDLRFQRAQRAVQSGQLKAYTPSAPAYSPPLFYIAPDTTIEDILGTTTYWDDKDSYRRYALLASALNANVMATSRGAGVFLSGWTETSPLEVTLRSNGSNSAVAVDTLDTTLYLVTLTPAIDVNGPRVAIPPSLFTWTLLESTQYTHVTPYEVTLSTGSYAFQFDLAQPISFSKVESLTLHLTTRPTQAQSGLNLFLWNWMEGDWERIEGIQPASGRDHPIPNPGWYVNPAGEVRLRVEKSDPAQAAIQIEVSDFTLVVER